MRAIAVYANNSDGILLKIRQFLPDPGITINYCMNLKKLQAQDIFSFVYLIIGVFFLMTALLFRIIQGQLMCK